MKRIACTLVAVGLLALPLAGQQPPGRIDVASFMIRLDTNGGAVAARRITSDHLQVTTFATSEVVAPGSVFFIVFDITPRERMHVYAPGTHDYKVIAFNLESNPLLDPRPMQYPASEIYFFEPLNERMPVFQKTFRLTQAMTIRTTPEALAALTKFGQATIKGTLDYQACDDRVCFLPQSIPIAYTVKVPQRNTERANVPR